MVAPIVAAAIVAAGVISLGVGIATLLMFEKELADNFADGLAKPEYPEKEKDWDIATNGDPQPEGKKSGNDPYVTRGEDNSKPWFYPVGNSIDCLGVERGQHDADRWLECPTYKFHKQTKVLVNNPMIGQPYNYEDFLGTHFTHVWQDANENMRIDQGETEEQVCDMLPTDVWGFPKYQPNGNKSTGKYYCSQIQEHFYAVDIVYMMKGT